MTGIYPSISELSLAISLSEQTTDSTQKIKQKPDAEKSRHEDACGKQLEEDVLASVRQILDTACIHETMEDSSANTSDANTNKRNNTTPSPALHSHCPIPRLLAPGCGGIPERIELLGELITIVKEARMSNGYDETALIIAAIERNARLQTGADGECLLALSAAAVSNRNIDLYHLDVEIERQFGLHSVEVTGDGACAFRATLISGLARSDRGHTEVRERVLDQVLKHLDYYRTALKPGEKATEEALNEWIETMSDPNTYADEMATIAMTNAYHLQLVIFRAGDLLHVINPRDGDVRGTAFLVNVGTHYKALVTRPELEQARRNSERLVKNQ